MTDPHNCQLLSPDDPAAGNTTEVMRHGVGMAVVELRRRMEWSQDMLAREIHKYSASGDRIPLLHRETIARWENGNNLPTTDHRVALAKLVAARVQHLPKNKETHLALYDLHAVFGASLGTWRVVAALRRLGIDVE